MGSISSSWQHRDTLPIVKTYSGHFLSDRKEGSPKVVTMAYYPDGRQEQLIKQFGLDKTKSCVSFVRYAALGSEIFRWLLISEAASCHNMLKEQSYATAQGTQVVQGVFLHLSFSSSSIRASTAIHLGNGLIRFGSFRNHRNRCWASICFECDNLQHSAASLSSTLAMRPGQVERQICLLRRSGFNCKKSNSYITFGRVSLQAAFLSFCEFSPNSACIEGVLAE